MPDTGVNKTGYRRFPEDEARFPWLTMLLDAYAIIDEGITEAIQNEEKKGAVRLACNPACDTCCRIHKDIPFYPLELVGIYWFTIEKTKEPERGIIKKQLSEYDPVNPCPFLINSSCSIYALRPAACRQFNVFGRQCGESEDPYYSRRQDVLTPIQDYTDHAFYVMLPFYGVNSHEDKIHIIKNRLLHSKHLELQACNWKELSKRMEGFDRKSVQTG